MEQQAVTDKKLPTRTDPSIKRREMELELINRFQGKEEQNTEITQAQRTILTCLEQLSVDFMPLSKELSTRKDITYLGELNEGAAVTEVMRLADKASKNKNGDPQVFVQRQDGKILVFEQYHDFWSLPLVRDWIKWFRTYGVPVGRKGRTEVAEVMKSYFEALREESKADIERSRMLR